MTVFVVDFSRAGRNPLNPLGGSLRQLIWDALDSAEKNKNISSLVLYGGKGRNFSAGADLTEFSKLKDLASKGGQQGGAGITLVDVVERIENFSKPVIAAIAGNALGGGLEVALSCHYRVTDHSGKFGLPEVHVGVIPGAGGTQRLPRVVGVATALEMILSGKPVGATKAKTLGLIDHIVKPDEENLLDSAKKWASWAALMPLTGRRVGDMALKESPEELRAIFKFAAKKLPKPQMGGEGVHAALAAVKACNLPIKEGMQVEGEQFFNTLVGSQGMARRHAFFAVRKAQKPLGIPPKDHPLLNGPPGSKTVAVIGAGLMGSGICMVLLQTGFKVLLVDVYKQALDKGMAFVAGTIKSHVKKGRTSEKKAAKMMSNLKGTQRFEDLAGCMLVVEAVIEDMKIKKKIFGSLDKITPRNCILLSNTSTLDVDEMASAVSPERKKLFAGWHFFSPAHVMKLVEIVKGKATSHETVCVMQKLTKQISKIGVVVGNCDGFVGNRLLISYSAETALLVEEGVGTISSVDSAILKFGMALGIFQMGDLSGLDVGYNIRKQRGWVAIGDTPAKNRPARYADFSDLMVTQYKRLGQKSGKGFYDYDPKVGRGRKGMPSKEVDEIIRKHCKKSSVRFTDDEVIERAFFPLVNEGFKCLEEGIAQQPSDIDVVYVYGYGWPVHKGGPMFWADHVVGLDHLLSRLNDFYRQFPETEYFKPSKLLKSCVSLGLTVEEYYARGLHKQATPVSKL